MGTTTSEEVREEEGTNFLRDISHYPFCRKAVGVAQGIIFFFSVASGHEQ